MQETTESSEPVSLLTPEHDAREYVGGSSVAALGKFTLRWLPLMILALVWQAASWFGLIPASELPPLTRVFVSFWHMMLNGEIPTNGLDSLLRLLAGLGLAIVVGVGLGLLMAWYKMPRIIFGPLVRILYPLPKTALIPILLLWFGLGDASKIMLIFLGTLLPLVISTFNGVRGVEKTMIWSARSLGCKDFGALIGIAFPAALPDILAGMRVALALSFILLVSSEFLMAHDGLGYMISYLGSGGAYSAMFAAVMVVSLLGFAADRAFLALTHRLLVWRG